MLGDLLAREVGDAVLAPPSESAARHVACIPPRSSVRSLARVEPIARLVHGANLARLDIGVSEEHLIPVVEIRLSARARDQEAGCIRVCPMRASASFEA